MSDSRHRSSQRHHISGQRPSHSGAAYASSDNSHPGSSSGASSRARLYALYGGSTPSATGSRGSDPGPSGTYDRNEPQGYSASHFGSQHASVDTVNTNASNLAVPAGGRGHGGGPSQTGDLYFRPGSSTFGSSEPGSRHASNPSRPPSSRVSNPSRRPSGHVSDPPRPGSNHVSYSDPREMININSQPVSSSNFFLSGQGGEPSRNQQFPVGSKSWDALQKRKAAEASAAGAGGKSSIKKILQKSKEGIERRFRKKK